MIHAYHVLLRLYPDAFRRRYAAEMSLDFEDALSAARLEGRLAVAAFASRALGDLLVSVLRQWTRGSRLAIGAVTTGATLLLWGLALRPWSWPWDVQPWPRTHPRGVNATEAELLILAALALVPVILVMAFAGRLLPRRNGRPRRL